jgi:Tol biopolymer transport system component
MHRLVGGFVALAAAVSGTVMTNVTAAHAACVPPQYCGPPVVVPVSRTHDDQWSSGGADALSSMSVDGRYVAFSSRARLVPADTNDLQDVYRRDMETNALVLVSRRADGGLADDWSIAPAISGDGRYVAFLSNASNLTAPCVFKGAPHTRSVFRKDLATGTVVKVNLRSDGTPGGSYLAQDILYDPQLSISTNGRFVAFHTTQTGLAGADSPNPTEVYRKDLATGSLVRVSVRADGGFGNGSSWHASISDDGRYVAFSSKASNFVTDTNGQTDVFRKDLTTGAVVRVSVRADGSELGKNVYPSMSSDGRFVSFTAYLGDATNEGDIDRKDLVTGELATVSSTQSGVPGIGLQGRSSISADGALVALESGAALVSGDTNQKQDVYVKRVATGAIKRVSRTSSGQQASSGGSIPSISRDGTQVSFWTAGALWSSDDNNAFDIYRTNLPLSI